MLLLAPQFLLREAPEMNPGSSPSLIPRDKRWAAVISQIGPTLL